MIQLQFYINHFLLQLSLASLIDIQYEVSFIIHILYESYTLLQVIEEFFHIHGEPSV